MKIILIALLVTVLSANDDLSSRFSLQRKLEYIHYQQNHKKNIIFIHGSLSNAEGLFLLAKHPRIKRLANSYLISLPNHGNSYDDPHATSDSITKDIKNFIIQRNLKNVYLVGHSLGGFLVMQFAAKYPFLIKGFLSLDYLPFKPEPGLIEGSVQIVSAFMKANLKQPRAKIVEYLNQFFPDPPSVEYFVNALDGSDGDYSWSANLQNFADTFGAIVGNEVQKTPFYGKAKFIFAEKSFLYRPQLIPRLVEYYPKIDLAKDVTILNGWHTFFYEFLNETVDVIVKLVE